MIVLKTAILEHVWNTARAWLPQEALAGPPCVRRFRQVLHGLLLKPLGAILVPKNYRAKLHPDAALEF